MLRQIDRHLHLHLLYPLRRWLTLQHFAAFMMLLYALSLISAPPPSFLAVGQLLHAGWFSTAAALLFIFFSARLIGQPVSEVDFRIATLPMFLYFFVVLAYVLSGQSSSWGGVLPSFAIWGFFQIAITPLSDKDHDERAD